jgi:chitinase
MRLQLGLLFKDLLVAVFLTTWSVTGNGNTSSDIGDMGGVSTGASRNVTTNRMVGYVENWEANPSKSVLSHYTHINIAFIEASNKNCSLSAPSASTVKLIHSAGVKAIGSVGGASMNRYWKYCTVEKLVSDLVAMVNEYDLDGIDIDYEVDPPSSSFVVDLHNNLRTQLPSGTLLTHAPENNMMVSGGAYWNILAQCKDTDFISVQYYNDDPNPAHDASGSIAHYQDVVNNLYGGDASKVVFGFCITDCSSDNMAAAEAAAFTAQLVAAMGSSNVIGGVMNWAVNQGDADGSWSTAVKEAMTGSSSDCSWIGHCKGNPCTTYDYCDGALTCVNGVCI